MESLVLALVIFSGYLASVALSKAFSSGYMNVAPVGLMARFYRAFG